ncbi:L-aspartate oxidase [Solibacillus cecembensis]|uniref:L-aspartate oxidase n=1 Tax=Solibacillus cecembensis TaxID=459347 RepID=UPI003D03F2EF
MCVKTTVKWVRCINIQTDIVILGGGIAALQAAQKLGHHFKVHLLTKADFTMSSSYKAQGGIAAVMTANDHLTLHIEDTLAAGEYHHHEENVKTLVEHGANYVKQLLNNGFPADYTDEGELSLGLEGAHSRHRIVHAGGDATGEKIIDYYIEGSRKIHQLVMNTYEFAYELLLNCDGECCGVRVKTAEGDKTYYASYIILATGGAGALYSCTSNQSNSYGDGIALAYLAGAEVTDMEFVQFHPSLLYVNGARGLVSEAVRGAGARFVNRHNKPIMEGKHPLGDLAPRHITAYEMYKMRAEGEEVFLDISMIESFDKKFPTITKLCQNEQIDLTKGKIPVAPGSHFLMGGIVATAKGETSIPRLFAVGEVACTGVHGANRLASNSLLEGITFGHLMAEHLVQTGTKQRNFMLVARPVATDFPPLLQKEQLQKSMLEAAGIVRSTEALQILLAQLRTAWQQIDLSNANQEQIELYFMHVTASLIVQAALLRTESRGAHIRREYKQQQSEWAKKWIVFQQGNVNVRDTLYEYNQIKRDVKAVFQ